jgi:hypothetical protein
MHLLISPIEWALATVAQRRADTALHGRPLGTLGGALVGAVVVVALPPLLLTAWGRATDARAAAGASSAPQQGAARQGSKHGSCHEFGDLDAHTSSG